MLPEPTVSELIEAFKRGYRGSCDELADVHDGCTYEIIGGAAAMLWSREAQYDTDNWNNTRLKTATGDTLTQIGFNRYGIQRILDTRGTGIATLARPNAVAGAGTVWDGTRILVSTSLTDSKYYQVVGNVSFGPAELAKDVPIEAVEYGPGSSVISTSARIDDTLWDLTFTVPFLRCNDGTAFEDADVYTARIVKSRTDARVGYQRALINACAAAGAGRVALFASNYTGLTDVGINVCYVGFDDYSSSQDLVRRCQIALESARCAGDNLQVLQMTASELRLLVNLTLSDSPVNFDTATMQIIVRDSIVQDLGDNGAWGYRLPSMRGKIMRNIPACQDVGISDGRPAGVPEPESVGVLVNIHGALNFPLLLPRYFIRDYNVSVTFQGPT